MIRLIKDSTIMKGIMDGNKPIIIEQDVITPTINKNIDID